MAFRLLSLVSFLREVRQELKGVQWPSREATVRFTALVIVVSAVVGLVTGAFDFLLTLAVERLL
ncbi:MAG: Protein translocase subunit SecE [Parcubacteria group bacterium Gr01-1014_38]|nr:MAG: Protein translocase subunit SecE [Parcubacteria group bacterium Gr01-1014_38]